MSDIVLPEGLTTLLKTAARNLINACAAPGQTGPQRVEAMTGYSAGQISKWQSENDPALMPVHVVAQLEAATGNPVFSRAIASLSGHQLVPVTEQSEVDFCLMSTVVDITSDHSQFVTQAMEAMADQKLTRGEFKGLLATLVRNQQRLSGFIRKFAARAGD